MRLPSAFWAVIGSLVTAIPIVSGQLITQYYESKRALQSLAYQYAWQEWKAALDARIAKDLPLNNQPEFRFKLLEHLIYASMISDNAIDKIGTGKGKDIFNIFLDEYYDVNKKRTLKKTNGKNQGENASDNHSDNGVNSR